MFRPPSQVSGFRFQVSRLLVACLCFAALATSSHALLGDTLEQISKHRGKPAGKPDRNKALWLFEGDDGQLAYAVKFDAAGKSIAETLRPGLIGRQLSHEIVMDFIKAHLEPYRDSKTLLAPQTGEKYSFAGQQLVVSKDESVWVDEANHFLIVWVRGSVPSVTAVRPAALQ